MPYQSLDDPDMNIDALLDQWPEMIPVFMRHRMLCVGCMVNPFHTLIDACAEYDLDEDAFRRELALAVATTAGRRRSSPADADRKP